MIRPCQQADQQPPKEPTSASDSMISGKDVDSLNVMSLMP